MKSSVGRTFVISLAAGLAVLAFLFFVLRPAPIGANDASRWATVWSLVHRGTFTIDGSPFTTVDVQQRIIDGEPRLLSSKPHLMATLVAGIYLPLHGLGLDLFDDTGRFSRASVFVLLVLINVVPLALFLAYYRHYLVAIGSSRWTRNFCMIAAGLGTYVTGYSSTLTNHVPSALSIFFCAYWYWRIRFRGERRSIAFLGVGFFGALAVTFDVQSGVFLLFVGLSLLSVASRRTLLLTLPAAALPMLALFGVEFLATGDFLPNNMSFALSRRTYTNFPGSYWANPDPIDRGSDSPTMRLLHSTLGHHGFFSLTPIWIVPLVYMGRSIGRLRDAGPSLPRHAAAVALMTAVVLAVFVVRTSNYGGFAQGLRWMFWVIPLWLMLLPFALKDLVESKAIYRNLAVAALVVSIASSMTCLRKPWGYSWLEKAMMVEEVQ